MPKRYRIAGTVTYVNDENQRLSIPLGTEVELEELDGENPTAVMRWKNEHGATMEQSLNLLEWAEYTRRGLKAL